MGRIQNKIKYIVSVKKSGRILPCFFAAASLTACSTPGIDLDVYQHTSGMYPNEASGANAGSVRYRVMDINESLIQSLKTADEIARSDKSSASGAVALAGVDDYSYKVGPGDVLLIKIWERPELITAANTFLAASGSVGQQVHSDGYVFFPYAGKVHVEGKTLPEVREQIIARMSDFLVNPLVDVNLAESKYSRVHVTGEIKEPKELPLGNDELTVMQAIEKAGGLRRTADLESAEIISKDRAVAKIDLMALYYDGDMSYNRVLQPGDTLHVPDNHRNLVYLMGEFLDPETKYIRGGSMTLAEAVTSDRGLNPITADASRIYVIRGAVNSEEKVEIPTDDFARIYHLNLSSADAMILADNFQLKPRDVVYVATADVTKWNRIISQILPSGLVNAVETRRVGE